MLVDLDAEQRAAATSRERLVRCRAGAGSGKTRCLTARIAWLVEQGVAPEKICAITFSKRAAEELWARVDSAIGAQAFVGTIHSLGYSIARAELPGRRVADESMRRKIIRRVMRERAVEQKFAEVLSAVARHKGIGEPLPSWARAVQDAYDLQLHEAKLWDFDDLLLVPDAHLRKRGDARARWNGRWQYILVDECQDTAGLQWRLIGHLLGPETGLFVVGDYSQAIYKWRGCDPDLMLSGVEELFGPFADYPLVTNYRSRPAIVDLANRVIDGRRAAVTLRAARCDVAPAPCVDWIPPSEHREQEAICVVRELREHHAEGVPWGSMLVLYRCNSQSEALEAACLRAQVPAIVAGGVGFYGRREIADVLAYLKLAVEWDHEALDRVYNRPSRYLGEAFRQELQRGGGWEAAIEGRLPAFSRSYMGERLREFLRDVRRLQLKYEANDARPEALVRHVLDHVGPEGYRAWLVGEEPSLEDEVRGENLDALLEAARGHATVAELLAFAARCERRNQRQAADGDGYVTLSTIHKQKGLEAPLVVVVGLTEGVLPHVMALREDPAAEEERRILYTAVTRARDRLILSCWGQPSRFWTELGGPSGMYVSEVKHLNIATGLESDPSPLAKLAEEWDADAAAAETIAGGAGDGDGERAAADAPVYAARRGGEPLGGGARDRGAADGERPPRGGDPSDEPRSVVDVAAAPRGGGAAGAGGAPWACAWCRWPNEPEAVNCSQCEAPRVAVGFADVNAALKRRSDG